MTKIAWQKIKCFFGIHEIEVRRIPRFIKCYPKDRFYDHENHCIKIRDERGLVVEVINDIDEVQRFLSYLHEINIYNMGEFVEYYCPNCKHSFGREKRLNI